MGLLSYILEQTINGLQLGAVYALIALGYTMVYGVLRLINFAHGDIFMFGAFTAYYLLSKWDLPLALVIPLTMAVTAFLGFLIEKLAYKPLRTAPKISLLITAVGVSLFLEYFLSLEPLFTPNYIGFPRPFEVIHYNLPLFTVTNIQVLIFLVTAVSLFWLYLLIYHTKYGRAMRALSHDQEAASLMGVPVDGIISLTFIAGAALAGLGGILYAFAYPQINVFMGIMPGIKSFIAAVLGGITGTIYAGMLWVAVIEGLRLALPASLLELRWVFIPILLILVMMWRPYGLLSRSESRFLGLGN